MGKYRNLSIVALVLVLASSLIECRDLVCEPVEGTPGECIVKEHGSFAENETVNIITTLNPEEVTSFDLDQRAVVTRVPRVFFEKFPNVNDTSLSSTSITHIYRDDFANATNLKELKIIQADIEDIDDFAFSDLTKLTFLYLPSNKLTIIRRNTLEGLINLETLSLASNRIETIEDGAFNFPKLTGFRLEHNYVKRLSGSMWRVTPPLESFYCKDNIITEIGTFLDGMTELASIDLNLSPVADYNFTKFAKLPSLHTLSIARSGFRNTTEEDVTTAEAAGSNLQYIYLSEDQLSSEFLGQIHRVFKNLTGLFLKDGVPQKDFSDEEIIKVIPNLQIWRFGW